MVTNNKVEDSTQMQVLGNRKKVVLIDQVNYKVEDACSLPGSCDEDEKSATNLTRLPVSETVWRIGWYKIDPSTTSGI